MIVPVDPSYEAVPHATRSTLRPDETKKGYDQRLANKVSQCRQMADFGNARFTGFIRDKHGRVACFRWAAEFNPGLCGGPAA
jgi:hypothetical protein